ncbi:hypothetical protein E3N88_14067 [Mikania micrantha]|uniref:Neprosin PEP catalytic domain-containing protein n=1 Tax=Mikania micrantha TaxID=192012 RepID=A0A5N6P1P3_9ASTR|nr:hypothetical protein E3N88_14067 [Mikania micrantha]
MHFVVVFMVAQICNGGRSRFPSSIKVHRHLNLLNNAPVKSIKSPDGDTIDCVHIAHQPAFDHPILKNHTIIKTRPSYHPDWIKDENINMNSSKSFTQLWHSNGKCPKGTIPIRRTKKEDMLRASSLKSYGRKNSVSRQSSIDSEFEDVTKDHEYATARTDGLFYGAKATFNLWNPKVQRQDEFSLGQLWITRGSGSDLNTIEAGWQVYPGLYGDSSTRLFIFWTSDGYQKRKCYNLGCPGFIQTNNEIVLGGTLSPISQVDGSQYEMTILIWKDRKEGDWWMKFGETVVGYWPASLFTSLRESASTVEWGGEVVNLKSDGTPESLQTYSPENSCYDIVLGMNDNSGRWFYYGGPGRNPNGLLDDILLE